MRTKNATLGPKRHGRLPWCAVTVVAMLWIGLSGCRMANGERPSVQRALEAAGLSSPRAPDRVSASGTIQADDIQIAGEFGGRIVEMHVQAGDPVRAGAPVAQLDATALLDKLTEAERAIAVARADLAAILAGPRQEEIEAAQAALLLAIAQRDGADAAWENARDVLHNPQELDARIIEARTQVKLAEQAAILAEAQLAGEQLLARQKKENTDDRSIADWHVKAAKEALAAARADHLTAQTLLDWLTYIRSDPLVAIARANAAQGEAQIAEVGVRVAQARLDAVQAGPTTQEIAVARQRVRLAQAQSDVLRTQIDKFTLHSPVNGIVLDQVIHKGELAAPAVTILTIASLDPVKLTVYVPVNQIGHAYLDQRVQVTVDSFPERSFSGRVTRIGDRPEYTPRNIATQEERLNTFYAVDVCVDNHDTLLKPGMPADATFEPTAPTDARAD